MEVTFRESYPPEHTSLTVKTIEVKDHSLLCVDMLRTYDESNSETALDFFFTADELYKLIGVLHKQLKEMNRIDSRIRSERTNS